MCCVHVVPDLGYEQMKISEGRRGNDLHATMVSGDVIESKGMAGKDAMMLVGSGVRS